MPDLITIRKRLEKQILSTGHTFREVSLNIGRKDSYIQQYVKYGFPKRLSEIDRKRVCQYLGIEEKELMDDELMKNATAENSVLNLQEISEKQNDFICIDIYEPRSSSALTENIIGRMAINYKEFYGWCNGNPYNLKIMRFNSDSMEPTVLSGSLIIFDSSVLEYSGDGLYIIRYDGQIMLKRLQRTSNGNYILKSENPRYQDMRSDESEIEILGRAINCLSSRPL